MGLGIIEVVILFAALWSVLRLWRERVALFDGAYWIMLAFALNLLAAAFSLAQHRFVWSSLDNPIRQCLATLVIGLLVLHRPRVNWFWPGLLTGTVLAAAVAVYQRFGLGLERASGVHMPIMFGDIAMAMGLMALAGIPYYTATRRAALPWVAFSAGVVASLLSGTRGSWAAVLLCLLPLYLYRHKASARKLLAIAFVGIVLAGATLTLPTLRVGQRIEEISKDIALYERGNVNSSSGARIEMWKGAWRMFVEHPVSGVGRQNFQAGLAVLISRGEINPGVGIYRHAHNEMLDALATEGLIGGLALLLVYAAPMAFFLRRWRAGETHERMFALAGMLLVLSFVYFGITQVLFSHHVGAAFYALTVSVLAGICMSLRVERSTPSLPGVA